MWVHSTNSRIKEWSRRRRELQHAVEENTRQTVRHARELNGLTLFPGFLPHEILADIIRIYVADWKASRAQKERFGFHRLHPQLRLEWLWASQYYGWISITHVCYVLRVVAHQSCMLWTDISLVPYPWPLEHVGSFLPLSVRVRKNTDSPSLHSLAPFSSRIRELDLRVNFRQLDRFAKHFNRCDFPHLQSLALVANRHELPYLHNAPKVVHPLFKTTTNLQRLLIGNLPPLIIDRLLRAHPHLKSLAIEMDESEIVDIDELQRLLRLVPELEVLTLEGDFFQSPAILPSRLPTTSRLSNLHTLRIHACITHASVFVSRLVMPNLKFLELHCSSALHSLFDGPVRSLAQAYGTLHSISLQGLNTRDNCRIHVYGLREVTPLETLVQSRDKPKSGFSLQLRVSGLLLASDQLADLANTLPLAQVQSFCLGPLEYDSALRRSHPPHGNLLSRTIRFQDYMGWETLLPAMSNVEGFCAVGNTAYVIPHFLTSTRPPYSRHDHTLPTFQKAHTPPPTLPKLRVLHIHQSEFGPWHGVTFKTLVDALASRVERSLPIETLIIRKTANLGPIEAGALRKHVGNLDWDRCPRWIRAYRPKYYLSGRISHPENQLFLEVESDESLDRTEDSVYSDDDVEDDDVEQAFDERF